MSIMYYGWDGKPISQAEWIRLTGLPNRHVADTDLGPLGRVSTIWLGLDHNFMPDGPPVIFETMIFGGPMDQEMVRYSTREDAQTGHDFLVTWLTSVLDQEKQSPKGGKQ